MDTTKNIIKTINKQDNSFWLTIRRKDPIHSSIDQKNNRSDWQDIKQIQYPNYL